MKSFPKGFWWGSASSAPQAEGAALEGGKSETIWDYWSKKEPGRFHKKIGSEDTSTFYKNWKEDIKLMKQLGHNSFRTSISWARLIPNGTGVVNPEAVEFYNNVIDELILNDIEPFINLFHFDMPMKMQDIGGWESQEVIDAYVIYAKTCFELFGDRVSKWFTFNEPLSNAIGGYLWDLAYPNVVDFKRTVTVMYNTVLAHSRAVTEYRPLNLSGEIGIILDHLPVYPRTISEDDSLAAKHAELFLNRFFLDPVTKGSIPEELIQILVKHGQFPEPKVDDSDIIKDGIVDLVGINYYYPFRVQAPDVDSISENSFTPECLFQEYEMPERKFNPHRGWEIYEKGIYDIAIKLKEQYANIPWFISENGMGVEGEDKFRNAKGQIQDDYRIDFVKEHLNWLHRAIEEGSNCKGYHLWTFIDCWSWTNAYKNRYGWYELDIETQERRIKKSGEWFTRVVTNNGIE
ncbi:glycoside hydrolase family 1 protein [Vibrio hannami]|uniref:glycoside hydrolase family 1 protein n=1 Tax=Vibrio hannami TaxID=2717094 RepID=UPI003EBD684D